MALRLTRLKEQQKIFLHKQLETIAKPFFFWPGYKNLSHKDLNGWVSYPLEQQPLDTQQFCYKQAVNCNKQPLLVLVEFLTHLINNITFLQP